MTKRIKLTQGKYALIDERDYQNLSKYKWNANQQGRKKEYWIARAFINKKTTRMSRYLLDAPVDKVVDHINHNTLDNRRKNLRIVTRAQNSANQEKQILQRKQSCIYKGVYLFRKTGRWVASIGQHSNKKKRYIGCYKTKELAAAAYNKEARKRYGIYAHLNKIKR